MNEKEINSITSEAENTEFLIKAFDHAADNLATDELKAQAHRCCEAYYGKDFPDGSPSTIMMIGFLWGINEGMRIYAALDGSLQPNE